MFPARTQQKEQEDSDCVYWADAQTELKNYQERKVSEVCYCRYQQPQSHEWGGGGWDNLHHLNRFWQTNRVLNY